eukprot:TRINITY_DN21463_c0_g1_i1.p1 TRINITY_DN21463_c0_g1~~TRINITY_DN21463_c0_g1_i1.p1  ORF type:complete len:717 (-),score=227.58 TRINITY_DN21463_c0_g1_i1:156-2306(-)
MSLAWVGANSGKSKKAKDARGSRVSKTSTIGSDLYGKAKPRGDTAGGATSLLMGAAKHGQAKKQVEKYVHEGRQQGRFAGGTKEVAKALQEAKAAGIDIGEQQKELDDVVMHQREEDAEQVLLDAVRAGDVDVIHEAIGKAKNVARSQELLDKINHAEEVLDVLEEALGMEGAESVDLNCSGDSANGSDTADGILRMATTPHGRAQRLRKRRGKSHDSCSNGSSTSTLSQWPPVYTAAAGPRSPFVRISMGGWPGGPTPQSRGPKSTSRSLSPQGRKADSRFNLSTHLGLAHGPITAPPKTDFKKHVQVPLSVDSVAFADLLDEQRNVIRQGENAWSSSQNRRDQREKEMARLIIEEAIVNSSHQVEIVEDALQRATAASLPGYEKEDLEQAHAALKRRRQIWAESAETQRQKVARRRLRVAVREGTSLDLKDEKEEKARLTEALKLAQQAGLSPELPEVQKAFFMFRRWDERVKTEKGLHFHLTTNSEKVEALMVLIKKGRELNINPITLKAASKYLLVCAKRQVGRDKVQKALHDTQSKDFKTAFEAVIKAIQEAEAVGCNVDDFSQVLETLLTRRKTEAEANLKRACQFKGIKDIKIAMEEAKRCDACPKLVAKAEKRIQAAEDKVKGKAAPNAGRTANEIGRLNKVMDKSQATLDAARGMQDAASPEGEDGNESDSSRGSVSVSPRSPRSPPLTQMSTAADMLQRLKTLSMK